MGISLNIIKDQSLSVDVEAWLSVNKPKVFKMGEMKDNSKHFQRIGSSNKTVHENIALEKENETKIIEKNKRIRSNRVPSKDLSNRLLIQKKAMAKFKKECQHGDRERFLIENTWATTHTLLNASKIAIKDDLKFNRLISSLESFKFSEKKEKIPKKDSRKAYREICKLRDEAVELGKKTFFARCKRHNLTEYKIAWKKIPRCIKCLNDSLEKSRMKKISPDRINKLERQKENREKMMIAIGKNKRDFIGYCDNHGGQLFKINKSPNTKSGYQYKCDLCRQKSNYKLQFNFNERVLP